MAIEYNESEQADVDIEESETVEIPASILGDAVVSPGDVIRLEVVSNPEDTDTIIVKYAHPKKRERKPEMGGIDAAVAEFEA